MTDLVDFADLGLPAPDFDVLRSAGKDRLSLALIDVRNRLLAWSRRLEEAGGELALRFEGPAAPDPQDRLDPLLWTLGHVAWFQDHVLGRPGDGRFEPSLEAAERRDAARASDAETLRGELVESLEATLAALDDVDEKGDAGDDVALRPYRRALFHEEQQLESLAVLAQSLGLDPGDLVPRAPARAARDAVALPATRWLLGQGEPGFAFDDQREPHPVDIPELEIDAQAVSWSQYGGFVEDGGYDELSHWSPAGRVWLERTSRRTPRHVEQMRHGVLRRRFGRTVRVPIGEPAVHVSWFEADAWCRWAGRRLPGEAEWEAAAHQGARRGLRVGDVCEWTATTYAPWPGYAGAEQPTFWHTRVQRGWSALTPAALHGLRIRRHASPADDAGFAGFRSCAA